MWPYDVDHFRLLNIIPWQYVHPIPLAPPAGDSHAELTAEQIREAIEGTADGCIENMCCPKCGHFDDLYIDVTIHANRSLVSNSGVDDKGGDSEWDDCERCECPECGHEGTVIDFKLSDAAIERAKDAIGPCVDCGAQCVGMPGGSVLCPKCDAEEIELERRTYDELEQRSYELRDPNTVCL